MTDSVFWLAVGGLCVTCVSAIGAKALREFSRHRLEIICKARDATHVLSEILRLHDRVALGVESLRVLGTAVLVGSGVYWFALRYEAAEMGPTLLAISLAAGVLVILAVEVWIPGAIVRLWAEPFLFHTWKLWRLVNTWRRPWSWVLDSSTPCCTASPDVRRLSPTKNRSRRRFARL